MEVFPSPPVPVTTGTVLDFQSLSVPVMVMVTMTKIALCVASLGLKTAAGQRRVVEKTSRIDSTPCINRLQVKNTLWIYPSIFTVHNRQREDKTNILNFRTIVRGKTGWPPSTAVSAHPHR